MNCLPCRLSLLEDLAYAASDLLDRAWSDEECEILDEFKFKFGKVI